MLYVVAAGFAFLTSAFAVSSDYRSWGWFAGIVYVVAAVASFLAARIIAGSMRQGAPDSEHGTQIFAARKVIVALVVCGAVFAPLAAEVGWRAEGSSGAHAQPEVPVIERAGDRVAAGHSPYLANPTQVGNDASSDSKGIDVASYFPYLPGMAVFGLTNALAWPVALTDARLLIVAFHDRRHGTRVTARVVEQREAITSPPVRRRAPTRGPTARHRGDDLPVIALVLLGLVLAARRSPILAGLALGCAATLEVHGMADPVVDGIGLSRPRRAKSTGPLSGCSGVDRRPGDGDRFRPLAEGLSSRVSFDFRSA